MSSGPSKDWNNLTIRQIESEDTTAILATIRKNFVPDEVLNNLLGSAESEERMCDIDAVVIHSISERLSLMAIEKETNKVGGVAIINVNSNTQLNVHSFVPRSPITSLVRSSLSLNFDVFKHFHVSEFGHISITVDRKVRSLGIASELLSRSINLCKEKKLPVISSLCTGPASQKLALKFGFQEMARKYYMEMLEENPTVNFTRKPSPDEFMAQMVLNLDYN